MPVPVRRLRSGAPGGRKVVDLHMRQVERDRDMAQAAVHADRALGQRHPVDQRIQPHRGPDLGRRAHELAAGRLLERAATAHIPSFISIIILND